MMCDGGKMEMQTCGVVQRKRGWQKCEVLNVPVKMFNLASEDILCVY